MTSNKLLALFYSKFIKKYLINNSHRNNYEIFDYNVYRCSMNFFEYFKVGKMTSDVKDSLVRAMSAE